jgi:hypothetical protein
MQRELSVPLIPNAYFAAALIPVSCDRPNLRGAAVAPPTNSDGFTSSWESSKQGFIYSSSYFTAGQVDNPLWEARRLSELARVKICQTGQQIVHRDVRWVAATKVSGQRCAAVIYTIACDVPTHATIDTLDQDREEALTGEIQDAPSDGCGANDSGKARNYPDSDMQQYLDAQSLLVDKQVCDFRKPRLNGIIKSLPRTRIGVTTVVDKALSARLDGHWQLPRLVFDFAHNPEWIIGSALRKDGKLGAIFPTSREVTSSPANIRITQTIGVGSDGRPYCVQVTARQGAQVWRRTIERSGAEAYAGIGLVGRETAHKPSSTPSDDERTLIQSLAQSIGLPS